MGAIIPLFFVLVSFIVTALFQLGAGPPFF
jgi:hypothetical protein